MVAVFDVLKERGFVQQCSDEVKLSRLLSERKITYYGGFECTADSLHVGSLMPIMAMAHLQRAGHQPIAIVGGGTTMIGDPSGKTEMRQQISPEEIESNGVGILAQLRRYLDFGDDSGIFLNNADWLLPLNYIEFLRDVGRYFKVNEMLKMEAYRQRLERGEGLSFIEFNYTLLQAYDFLLLFQRYGCLLQVGGNDQWGNILAGLDLIRRIEGKTSHGLTVPLLTTGRGEKMGKTERGAVWLDAHKTSPYEFYQYWINSDDRDVERLLAYFTFLDMEDVRRFGSLEGAALRESKELLAYEVTKLAHGEQEARNAQSASKAAFGGMSTDLSGIPTSVFKAERIANGIPIIDLLCEVGLTSSRGEARRLIQQGGSYLNDAQVTDLELVVGNRHLVDNGLMLRHGKKQYHWVQIGEDG